MTNVLSQAAGHTFSVNSTAQLRQVGGKVEGSEEGGRVRRGGRGVEGGKVRRGEQLVTKLITKEQLVVSLDSHICFFSSSKSAAHEGSI